MNFGRIITLIAIGIIGIYSFCQAIHSTYKFNELETIIKENREYCDHMNTVHRLYCDDLKYICDSLMVKDSLIISKYNSLNEEINRADSLLNKRIQKIETIIKK